MLVAIYVVHVIVCFALILIVLLQSGKGSELGAAFGGGASQTLFGSAGRAGVLGKLTAGAAIVFMITCLFLAWASSQKFATGVMKDLEEVPAQPQPLTPQPATTELPPAEAAIPPAAETAEPGAPATPPEQAPPAPAAETPAEKASAPAAEPAAAAPKPENTGEKSDQPAEAPQP